MLDHTRILDRYRDRLTTANKRSIFLNAHPGTRRDRIDIARLGILDEQLPQRLLHQLMHDPQCKMTIDLRASKQKLDGLINADPSQPEKTDQLRENLLLSIEKLDRSLFRLKEEVSQLRRDKGYDTLMLGYPLLCYKTKESKVLFAPLFLWPFKLTQLRARIWSLSLDTDSGRKVEQNTPLSEYLKEEHQVIVEEVSDEVTSISHKTIQNVLGQLAKEFPHQFQQFELGSIDALTSRESIDQAKDLPNISPHAILGKFEHHKESIIRDIDALKQQSSLIEQSSLSTFFANTTIESHVENNRAVFSFMSLDSSQRQAMLSASCSPFTIIQGPPGTGKSQVLTEIICQSIRHGEKVLVCCEKNAAFEVIINRLKLMGLDHLCTHVRDAKKDKKAIYHSMNRLQIEDTEHLLGSSEIESLERRWQKYHEEIRRTKQALYKKRELGLSYIETVDQYHSLKKKIPSQILEELKPLSHQTGNFYELNEIILDLHRQWKKSDFQNYGTRRIFHFTSESIKHVHQIPSLIERFLSLLSQYQQLKSKHLTQELFLSSDKQDLSLLEAIYHLSEEYYDDRNHILAILKSYLLDSQNTLQKIKALLLAAPHQQESIKISPQLSKSELRQSILDIKKILNEKSYKLFTIRAVKRIRKLVLDHQLEDRDIPQLLEALEQRSQQLEYESECLSFSNDLHSSLPKRILKISLVVRLDTILQEHQGSKLSVKDLDSIFYDNGQIRELDSIQSLIHMNQLRFQVMSQAHLFAAFFQNHFIEETLHTAIAKVDTSNQYKSEQVCLEEIKTNYKKVASLFKYEHMKLDVHSDLLSITIALEKHHDGCSKLWQDSLRFCFYQGIIDHIHKTEHLVADFDYEDFEYAKSSMLRTEEKLRDALPGLVKSQHQKAIKDLNQKYSHSSWQARFPVRGKDPISLRKSFERSAKIFLEASPVWMASPETVCSTFPLHPNLFDLIILDEASQVRVEDAVPAIYRARRVVVSGDRHQMPPSNFFLKGTHDELDEISPNSSDISEEDLVQLEVQDSLIDSLDLLSCSQGLSAKHSFLNIHYRSHFPELIEFSNKAFYEGKLCSLPRNLGDLRVPIELKQVKGIYSDRTNSKEADELIKILKGISLDNSSNQSSIGIVTFNQDQRYLILEKLLQLSQADTLFKKYYERMLAKGGQEANQGLFVKSLEEIQGDERDIMIISTTFGPKMNGPFNRNFGPIIRMGGERRLNVLITRARIKSIIVTSIPESEYQADLQRIFASHSQRAYFYAYLKYAKAISEESHQEAQQVLQLVSNIRSNPKRTHEHSPFQDHYTESPLEEEIYQELEKRYPGCIETQVRVAGFRIDLAIKNSRGDYILGIEADGASFHSDPIKVDDDIQRQKILEGKGWVIFRIWSTDWWHNSQEVMEQLVELIEDKEPGYAAAQPGETKSISI